MHVLSAPQATNAAEPDIRSDAVIYIRGLVEAGDQELVRLIQRFCTGTLLLARKGQKVRVVAAERMVPLGPDPESKRQFDNVKVTLKNSKHAARVLQASFQLRGLNRWRQRLGHIPVSIIPWLPCKGAMDV